MKTNEEIKLELVTAIGEAMLKLEQENRWTTFALKAKRRAQEEYRKCLDAYNAHLELTKN